ncbi:MAG: hypothetical protein Q7T63_22925 [Burkholderiaceae bacterium]|nr:hypothetical protein [Burkholderiaceae bacterium]MDP3135070.1 hypothetical protein [Burkholderiaceae bacterium]
MIAATQAAEPVQHINPRWVQTVLRTRGIPAPPVQLLGAAIATLHGEQSQQLRERVQRLHNATERGDDMTVVADWVRTIREAPAQPDMTPAKIASEPCPRPSSAAPQRPVAERHWDPSHRVYGSKAAATFEPTVIPAVDAARELPFHTLMVEMAPAETRSRYDWERKIIFRLTSRELPLVVAWLFGWCGNLEFGGHGEANDKALILEDQKSHLFMKMKQGRRLLALQIGGEEVPALAALALKAMHLNAPWMDTQTQLQVAKRAGSLYALSVASRSA